MDIPSGESVARFDYARETAAHRAEIRALDRAWELSGRVVRVALPDSGTYLVFRNLPAAESYLDLLALDLGRTRDKDQLDLTPAGASFRSCAHVMCADQIPPAALRAPNVTVYPYYAPEGQDRARSDAFARAAEARGDIVACQLVGCGGYVVAADVGEAQRYLELLVQRLGAVRRDERSAVLPQPGFAPQIRVLDVCGKLPRGRSVMLRMIGEPKGR